MIKHLCEYMYKYIHTCRAPICIEVGAGVTKAAKLVYGPDPGVPGQDVVRERLVLTPVDIYSIVFNLRLFNQLLGESFCSDRCTRTFTELHVLRTT